MSGGLSVVGFDGNTHRHSPIQKRLFVLRITQVHRKCYPFSLMIENRDVPFAFNIFAKLPKDMMAILI